MDIYMKSISFSATKNQIYHEIARVLHSPEYQQYSTLPLNFYITLFPDRVGHGTRSHGGSGLLTLPIVTVGAQFLSEYAGTSARNTISVRNRRIFFQKSKYPPRQETLQSIRGQPYVDPEGREEREARMAQLRSQAVSIKTLQFGWECRDSTFSVEWEKHFHPGSCSLHFEQDRREMRIKLWETSRTQIIAIRFSTIQWSGIGTFEDPTLFFSLDMTPTFESELPPDRQQEVLDAQGPRFKGSIYDIEPRVRLSCLDEDHHRVVPYVSLAMRLICSSVDDLSAFEDLRKVAQMTRPGDFPYLVVRRGLFSAQLMGDYTCWMARLEWKVAFQIEALLRGLCLDPKEILDLENDIESIIGQYGVDHTSGFIRYFGVQVKELFSLSVEDQGPEESILECFQRSHREFIEQKRAASVRPRAEASDDVFQCIHVKITPTTMILEGPFPERSNRVMRWYPAYHDHFVRVTFVEETSLQFRWDREVDGRAFVAERVGGIMHGGLLVAGRTLKFLAYSQSALKEHAVWFLKPFGNVTPMTIIERIGAFDAELMLCPSRYGARISQAFTATDVSVSVEAEEVILDSPDIVRNGHCFTDGMGTMSRELCDDIWTKLIRRSRRRRGLRPGDRPSAYQIRLMGSKGMIIVDPKLSGRIICLPTSMIKFQAPESRQIEVARAFDRPTNYLLNRPLIMILEGLGVPYEVFEDLQTKAVREAQSSVDSLDRAGRLLESHGLGGSFRLTSVMLSLHKLGVTPPHDVFYQQLMEFAINHVLRELKHHARIPVVDSESWTLVGVADIQGFLEENTVFACVHVPGQRKQYLEGQVLVTRSPCIHPGDAQIVTAIGRPPPGSPFLTEPLANTVVFSTKGSRPLASCLGGGDLDGDLYNVTALKDLIPPRSVSPGNYDAAPKKLLGRPSTLDDVADFVVEYISSDVLGIIAINWLIIADQSSDGIFDEDCMTLAQLHSDAVDYPKSGQPVPLKKIPKLKFREKPDWNAPETIGTNTGDYYLSQRAIGKLFRAIDMPALRSAGRVARAQRKRQLQVDDEDVLGLMRGLTTSEDIDEDPSLLDALEEHVSQYIPAELNPARLSTMWILFRRYAAELYTICAANTLSQAKTAVLTEEEAIVGTIVANTSQPRKRRDLMSRLRDQTSVLVSDIREELAGQYPSLEERLERGWAAWKISNGIQSFGGKSFGWIALGVIFETTKAIDDEDRYL